MGTQVSKGDISEAPLTSLPPKQKESSTSSPQLQANSQAEDVATTESSAVNDLDRNTSVQNEQHNCGIQRIPSRRRTLANLSQPLHHSSKTHTSVQQSSSIDIGNPATFTPHLTAAADFPERVPSRRRKLTPVPVEKLENGTLKTPSSDSSTSSRSTESSTVSVFGEPSESSKRSPKPPTSSSNAPVAPPARRRSKATSLPKKNSNSHVSFANGVPEVIAVPKDQRKSSEPLPGASSGKAGSSKKKLKNPAKDPNVVCMAIFENAAKAQEKLQNSDELRPDVLPLVHIGKVMKELCKIRSFSDGAMGPGLSFLDSTIDVVDVSDATAKAWFGEVGKCKFVEFVATRWDTLWKPTSVLNDEAESDRILNFTAVCGILMNATDIIEDVCGEICDAGMIGKLLEPLRGPDITPQKLEAGNDALDEAFDSLTTIVYNCMRHSSEKAKALFRSADGVKLLTTYANVRKPMLKAMAAILLAYGIEESENALLCNSNSGDALKYLIDDVLKSALASEDHRDPDSAFSATETIWTLNKLAVNDENKLRIAELGVMPLCKTVIMEQSSAKPNDEIAAATTLLWALSFNEKNLHRFQQMPELLKGLRDLSATKDDKTSRAISGIFWNLEAKHRKAKSDSAAASSPSSQAQQQQHVMISYDWGHQELVLLLNKGLKDAGYVTWMDVDRMKGSTDDAMAKAIEDAAVVIVCVSERYKNSFNCRKEADYASEREKVIVPVITQAGYKADGWLAIQIAGKLRFDCSDVEKTQKALPSIINELGDRGKFGVAASTVNNRASALRRVKSAATIRNPKENAEPSVAKWSPEEVQQWLKRSNLEMFLPKFKKFNGEMLLALCEMYRKAPAVFYDQAKRELGANSLSDLLLLAASMDKLH